MWRTCVTETRVYILQGPKVNMAENLAVISIRASEQNSTGEDDSHRRATCAIMLLDAK